MTWILLLLLAALVAIVLMLQKSAQISDEEARTQLQNGALVIDVRSPREFDARHLTQAINLTLDDIEQSVPARFADKNQPILLHCASGMRSSVAKAKLTRLGYTRVFNLGSYDRAQRLVDRQRRP